MPEKSEKSAAPRGSVTLPAPAKVNLFLRVISKRPDGYHELATLMQPVSLYDTVRVSTGPGGGIRVSCSGEGMPQGRDNIAHHAAELVVERARSRGIPAGGVEIEIEKAIPAGAGLGGGSSDAAAVLMGLNELIGAGLSRRELMDLGARLGSDVPFFILRGPALARGRGEVLTPVELPPFDYVLINPGFNVSTAWVYSNLDLTKRAEDNILTVSVEPFKDPENIEKFLVNDLEPVTTSRHPEINRLKAMLLELGAAGALMSGSGPTVFAIFRDRPSALAAFDAAIVALDSRHRVFHVTGLTGAD